MEEGGGRGGGQGGETGRSRGYNPDVHKHEIRHTTNVTGREEGRIT